MKLGLEIDMNGCPNRCQHCWIGNHPDGHISIDEFISIVRSFRAFIEGGTSNFSELVCRTWFREPDYADNYRELWDIEKRESTAELEHFELASAWRLVRDTDYAPWLRSLGVETVQLTLFGTERNTDYFTGRKGSFRDIMQAIDILIANGILPRIQIFPFNTTLNDVNILWYQLQQSGLEEKIRSIGREPSLFFNVPTPMGNSYHLTNIALRKQDVARLSPEMIRKTIEHFRKDSIYDIFRTEAELLPELQRCDKPLNDTPVITSFLIDGDGNTYPNCGELTDWWYLGNVRKDEVATIMSNFTGHNAPGLKMNYEVPVRYFAEKYGDPNGDRVWTRTDLVLKWIRMEGLSL